MFRSLLSLKFPVLFQITLAIVNTSSLFATDAAVPGPVTPIPISVAEAELFPLSPPTDNAKLKSEPQFFFSSEEVSEPGKRTRSNRFLDSLRREVVSERIVYMTGSSHPSSNGSGPNITEYELNHHQTKTHVLVSATAESFTVQVRENGREKPKMKKFDRIENRILPPGIIEFFQSKWDELASGKEIEFTLLVPDILNVVTFVVQSRPSSAGVLRLRMKPSYWHVSLIVDPIFFEFDRQTKRIRRVEGRTLLLDETKKPFVAKTVFK